MPEEIREKCLKIIADSCELDIKDLVLQLEEEFQIEYHDFEELTFHMNELDELIEYLVKLIQKKRGIKDESKI